MFYVHSLSDKPSLINCSLDGIKQKYGNETVLCALNSSRLCIYYAGYVMLKHYTLLL